MLSNKSKILYKYYSLGKIYIKYGTRKDKHHKNKAIEASTSRPYYKKKSFRKTSNKLIRLYKQDIQNGDYKKIYDLKWIMI